MPTPSGHVVLTTFLLTIYSKCASLTLIVELLFNKRTEVIPMTVAELVQRLLQVPQQDAEVLLNDGDNRVTGVEVELVYDVVTVFVIYEQTW